MGRTAVTIRQPATRRGAGRATKTANRRRTGHRIGWRGAVNIFLTTLAIMFVTLLTLGLPSVVLAYNHFTKELPSPETIASRPTFKTARILDREGRLLYEIIDPHGGRRTVVPLSEIAKPLQLATIAVEDATFYVNPGFDLRAIARAIWQNVTGNQIVSGASTITQQLVKNAVLTNDVTMERKVKEAVLAWEASRRYTKEEILEMYLNEVYYGNMAYGVEAAAQTYFGKHASALDLAESALLAGLGQLPAEHDPFSNPKAATERQGIVLDLMVKYEFVTLAEAAAARNQKLAFRRPSEAIAVPLKAPHFSMYVRDWVEMNFGRDALYRGGLEIETTLDLSTQEIAEQAITEHLAKIRSLNATNAALVAIDPASGEIRAMVGSADYFADAIEGQVNVALSLRQPGSTLKPFVYLTAFGEGYTPASILQDVPTTFAGGYKPQNHDKKFRGPVTIRNALAGSLNVPAVQMLQSVGIDDALATIHRLGINDLNDVRRFGLTLALGGGEVKLLDLTFAYVPFASGGFSVGSPVPAAQRKAGFREFAPAAVRRITDATGHVLYQYQPPAKKQVVDPQLAYLVTSILSDDIARSGTYGRHSFLELSRPAAAKTGTTDDFRDGWTVGYTPNLVAGVWVGNSDNSAMLDVYGVSGAGYIWHNFMERALAREPALQFEKPPGVKVAKVCAETGQPPTANCKQVIDEVFAATMPTGPTTVPTGGTHAQITAPAPGARVIGMVDVVGTATATRPISYTLDFAPGSAPERWTIVGTSRPFSVEGNLLGRWDTAGLPYGPYTLRLRVYDGSAMPQTALVTVTLAPSSYTPQAAIVTKVPAAPVPAATPTRISVPTATPKPPTKTIPTATTKPAAAPVTGSPTAKPTSPTPTARPS